MLLVMVAIDNLDDWETSSEKRAAELVIQYVTSNAWPCWHRKLDRRCQAPAPPRCPGRWRPRSVRYCCHLLRRALAAAER